MDTLERKIRKYNYLNKVSKNVGLTEAEEIELCDLSVYLAKYSRLEKDGNFLAQHKITIDEGKMLQDNIEVNRPDFIKFAFTL